MSRPDDGHGARGTAFAADGTLPTAPGNGDRPVGRHHDATVLPQPAGERWQPLRAGLVDVFYYDREEFWFRDGRLLLRGNNGTGKSKVLALTLPFLLDGEVAPHRVEPDGDRAKRMEWNLLLDGRYPERTGYTWLELGRDTADGPRYLTLGCGLKAVAGRGAPTRWLFATEQRVGVDLWLVSDTGTARTKERLTEALDATGRVVDQPSAWRRLVDERLFGLGEERYDALLRLLIQLRQPQLSRRPDEAALSEALTEALSPPDQDMVHDVATAFRELEADRAALDNLAEARDETADFARRYARTAAIATRRAAARVREAQSGYERVNRAQAEVDGQLADARGAERAATAARDAAVDELARATARDRALRDSEVMSDARALEREDEIAREHAGAAAAAAGRAREADAAHDRAVAELADAEAALAAAVAADDDAQAAADAAATDAGVADEHRALLDDADARAKSDADARARGDADARRDHLARGDADAAARQAATALARRRDEAVAHIRGLARAARDRADDETRARRRRDEAAREHDRAADAERDQRAAVADAGAALGRATRTWTGGLRELEIDGDELEAAVMAWADSGDGDDPLRGVVRDAHAHAARRLAAAAADVRARDHAAREERQTLVDERDVLDAGGVRTPAVPPTRDPAAREGRPGAPLWQVVDFAPALSADERAGLEAALEAGGLLDAWVTPDGSLLDAGTLDVVVTAGPPAPRSLADALRPVIEADGTGAAPVDDAAVTAVLTGIGLGAASAATWVDVDGRYRVGPLEGAWRIDSARYVGHAARQRARRDRLDELARAITDVDDRLAQLAGDAAAVRARQERLEAEVAASPDDRALLDAHAVLAERVAAVVRAARDLAERDTAVASAARAAVAAIRERDEAAADLRLPPDEPGIDEVAQSVASYRAACAELWPARRHRRHARATHEQAGHRVAETAAAHTRACGEADDARRLADASGVRVETLRARVGGAVAELHDALAAVADRIASCERRRDAAERSRSDAHDAAIRLEERARGLAAQADTSTEHRRAATAAFQRFAATGLVAAAAPDVNVPDPDDDAWAPDPTVRLCRRVDASLGDVDASDEAWQRADTRLVERFAQLAEVLSRHGHHAELRREADAPVVSVAFRQDRVAPAALVAMLERDLADREQLLSHRERELLEEHLVAEVAAHLSERIAAAEAQVAGINDALARRPTSTGMALALRWRPRADAPTGLPEARRRLLRQRAEAWSDDDRQAVGAFLADQIAAARAAREGGTWVEYLSEALDYRRWHEFVVERRRDGRWSRALGPASGGERALAMTVPMLAAAASFYDTAGNRLAPRPIMLDEAFAGIDDDARAKCYGLLAEFDLDVVLTSEREWGCFPTVPGLAIAQLARVDGIDAVHVSRWEWDGVEPRPVDITLPPLREPTADHRSPVPADADGG